MHNLRCVLMVGVAFVLAACGDNDEATLDGFLPDIPEPTGETQGVWAGEVTSADELIDGPASSGLIGDFFIRNSKARYVIQSTARVIGVVPQGGNLVDAVALDGNGDDIAGDHFGELGMVYLIGRTCEHQQIEVVQDGSGGGAAVIRARGVAATNDFINIRGIGLLSIPIEIDPDIEDGVECATTYVLEPDSTALKVYWTLFNPGDTDINGPFGCLNDTGGNTEAWAPTRGFERLGISAITTLSEPSPIDYTLYQGPGVSYGIVPRHESLETTNSAFLIAGVSVVLFGAEKLLDMLNEDFYYLHLPAGDGLTHALEVVVGADAADTEEVFRTARDEAVAEISGTVAWAQGGVPFGARVGLYEDSDSDSDVGEDDVIRTYFDVDAEGNFSGQAVPGNYLVRAEVKDAARSVAQEVTLSPSGLSGVSIELPNPVYYDYEIVDDATGNFIPGKIAVIGSNPVYPDDRLFETYDRLTGVVKMVRSLRGTTIVGDDADRQFALAPGSTYRIIATRGTEWSSDSIVVSPLAGDPVQSVVFHLRQVAPAVDYLSSEYHIHMVGSPDSPVLNEDRVATAVADGMEFFAATDHDFVTDLQPVIEELGVEEHVRSIPGIEITPFVYGHFNAWPMNVDYDNPNQGAVDWATGTDGYAMVWGEIFDAARDSGAVCVQVNHPRAVQDDVVDFQQAFDRAGVRYDYDDRIVDADPARAPVPNDWMRLPESTLWDDSFNTLEVWNGFSTADSNEDGVREIAKLDVVMRDWFNLLSLGINLTPTGSSDSHTIVKDPAGMPRTYVRVLDDSTSAIESGAIVEEALDTLAGRDNTPRDVVVTNGPHIMVTVDGAGGSPLGSVVDGTSGSVTLNIDVYSPEWAKIDTIEIFANATPKVGKAADPSALEPLLCYTAREGLEENDVCALASGGAMPLTVNLVEVAPGINRYEASTSIVLTPADIINREGATGDDAWIVVRVYGTRAVFPMMFNGVMDGGSVDTLVSGTIEEQDAILDGTGIPATAFTAPIYIDFDGGGYTAVFSPE